MCVCVCGWEWVEDVCVQGGIITGWFNLLYSIFDEVNSIFLLACPVACELRVAIVVKLLSNFPWEDSLSAAVNPSLLLFRLPNFMGGVQPHKHQSYPLPAERHLRVQGHWTHCSHHLHHWSSRNDLQRPGPAVLLHYLLWRPTRSVTNQYRDLGANTPKLLIFSFTLSDIKRIVIWDIRLHLSTSEVNEVSFVLSALKLWI